MNISELKVRMQELDGALDNLKAQRKELEALLRKECFDKISEAYADKEEPCGVAYITLGNERVKINVSKKVSYDQSTLASIRNSIASSGENPDEYIKAEYTVEERKFKNWPANLQSEFISARTVSYGEPKFDFVEPRDE